MTYFLDDDSLKMKNFKEETKKGIKFYTVDKYIIDMKISGAQYNFRRFQARSTFFIEFLTRKFFDKIPVE